MITFNYLYKLIKILFFNLIILLLFFLLFEIIFRLSYPEFKDDIHSSDRSINKKLHWHNFNDVSIRTTKSKEYSNAKDGFVLIYGDSVSGGYGLGYQDIWWKQLENFLKIKNKYYNFTAITRYGSSAWDTIDSGKDFITKLKNNNIKPVKFIYQFNFNDIIPFRHSNIKYTEKSITEEEGLLKYIWFKFAKFRYEHLNKSVFLRVAQHYSGYLRKKTSGSCEERAIDALGPYTYTFGSKSFKEESLNLWDNFEESIIDMNNFLSNNNIKFEIMISPLLFQVDKFGYHKNYNHRNYDFNCSTIDPINRLKNLSISNNITLYNPNEFVHSQFMKRVNDENFEPFFHNADENHPNEIASRYIAEFIAKNWKN